MSLCVASGSAGLAGHSAVERETALVSLLSSRPLCGSLTVLAGNYVSFETVTLSIS